MTHRPPPPPDLRRTVERRAAGPLAWFAAHRVAAFLAVLILAAGTAFTPGPLTLVPGLLLLAILGLLFYVAAPLLPPAARAIRVAVIVLVVVLVVLRSTS